MEVHTLNCQLRGVSVGAPDAATNHRLDAHTVQRPLETGEPLNHRAPFSDHLIRVDKKAERSLYRTESADGLYDPAEGKIATEVAWRRDERREDPSRLLVTRSEVGQPLLAAHDVPPVHHHRLEPFPKTTELVRLAPVEGHSFGVLAEAYQAEPEVGFTTLLVVV